MSVLNTRWRGFNLLEKFNSGNNNPYLEEDFRMISNLGFNYARLPVDYRCYVKKDNPEIFDEKYLGEIDQAVGFGMKYGIHVCLNLHRAPGYCVNPPKEPVSLWKERKAREQFAYHWQMFAKRYKDMGNDHLSFNLVNEPPRIGAGIYYKAMKTAIDAIREADPERIIVVDGLCYGNYPVKKLLKDERIIQSARGYFPFKLTHYKAPWVGKSGKFMPPSWTSAKKEISSLNKHFKKWIRLKQKGKSIFVGECGCYIHTPHEVFLAWLSDNLKLWKENNIGWALWNFRGDFGILDSNRTDVNYEEFKGHKLDRKMLDLLLKN